MPDGRVGGERWTAGDRGLAIGHFVEIIALSGIWIGSQIRSAALGMYRVRVADLALVRHADRSIDRREGLVPAELHCRDVPLAVVLRIYNRLFAHSEPPDRQAEF